MTIEVGLSQLEIRLPAALPTGTRRDAIPPTAAPRAKGVRIDDADDAVSIACSWRSDEVPERSAYAAPRTMMPRPATNSATESVEAIDPNATGYAVQTTVSTKISHTWLASQTGAIDSWACSRMCSPRSPRPAPSCHTAAPKSAPPSTTYSVSPMSANAIGSW